MNRKQTIKVLLIGVLGTALQWYDFALFGYFAPIIATTYFPESSPFAGLLSALGIFAVGYLLAPIGALCFGYIGDRLGRKKALTISILAMAIPTLILSIVPGYQTLGITAPILVTLLRISQGFVASAEFTGSAIFLVEHAKVHRRALFGSLTSSGYSFGCIAAGIVASFLTASSMPSWSWRLGFGIAIIAALLVYYLRTQLDETPLYLSVKNEQKPTHPFLIALKEMPLTIVGVIGIAWLTGIMTFGTYVFSETYLHHYFHFPLHTLTIIITCALAVDALAEPFIAMIADKIGYLTVMKTGMFGVLLFSIPAFQLIASGSLLYVTCGLVLLSLLIAVTFASCNAYLISLFPKHYRYSGFGVAFHIGISIFGGTTPLVMMWLVDATGNLIAPAWYYLFGAAIGLLSLRLCEKTRNIEELPNFGYRKVI